MTNFRKLSNEDGAFISTIFNIVFCVIYQAY